MCIVEGKLYLSTQPKRILIVDNFPTWRGLIKTLLQLTPEWQLVGEASNGAEAEARVRELRPDIVLLEIDLPVIDGIQLARRLHAEHPETKLVFVTTENSREMAEYALTAGALGYILKISVVAELLPALNAVMANKRFISKGVLK
jgi:DNA-binding NarL/FixJ family response regulator